jgi:hypothetical protein
MQEDKEFTVRNFVCVIHKMRPEQALVETEVHDDHVITRDELCCLLRMS